MLRFARNDILREFQHKTGLYLERKPDKDDVLDGLALMRHYGAPTRPTDWTYSFSVAALKPSKKERHRRTFYARYLTTSSKLWEWLLNSGAYMHSMLAMPVWYFPFC